MSGIPDMSPGSDKSESEKSGKSSDISGATGMDEDGRSGQGSAGEAGTGRDLAEQLACYPLPAYRRAYLASLLESGARFLAAGNSRGAAYCHAKVAGALRAAGKRASGTESGSDAAGTPAREAADAAPAEKARRVWRGERIRAAEEVLAKHGGRLSALENRTYQDNLEKLKRTGSEASGRTQSDKADAGLLDLRRRLYQRILKSQKVGLKRRRLPAVPGRLSVPAGHPAQETGIPGLPSRKPVRVDTAWQSAVGPYNDRYNLEDLLSLIADADPAWVEEFLELYWGLSGLQGLVAVVSAAKK